MEYNFHISDFDVNWRLWSTTNDIAFDIEILETRVNGKMGANLVFKHKARRAIWLPDGSASFDMHYGSIYVCKEKSLPERYHWQT